MKPALIIADAAQADAATTLCGAVYEVFTLGTEPDLSNRRVLAWPNGSPIEPWAQTVANLPRGADDAVKLLASSKTPSDFTDWTTFFDWAKKNAQVISPQRSGAASLSLDETDTHGVSRAESAPTPDHPDMPPAFETDDLSTYADLHSGDGYMKPIGTWDTPLNILKVGYVAKLFRPEWLPEPLQDVVGDEAERKGTDIGISALSALMACSAAANDQIRLQVGQHDTSWTERPCLWGGVIGDSGAGKSPAMMAMIKIIKDLDYELSQKAIDRRKAYDYEMDAFRLARAAALKKGEPCPAEPASPNLAELWISRATMEGAFDALQYTDRGVFWFRDELTGLINEFDRYAAGGKQSGDREAFLELFNGGYDKRRLKGVIYATKNASAVVFGGTQPDTLKQCVGRLPNDGLLQRMILCCARTKQGGQDRAVNAPAYARYETVIRGLLAQFHAPVIRMSPKAAAVHQAFCAKVDLLVKYEESASLRFHLGKWHGLSVRLMLLYMLVDRAANGQEISASDTIDERTAQRVVDFFMGWQLSNLQQFWYEIMASKESRSFAKTLFQYIISEKERKEFSITADIHKHYSRRWGEMKPWEQREAMNLLIEAAILMPKGSRKNSNGVYTNYMVNPLCDSVFAEEGYEEALARRSRKEQLQELRAQRDD